MHPGQRFRDNHRGLVLGFMKMLSGMQNTTMTESGSSRPEKQSRKIKRISRVGRVGPVWMDYSSMPGATSCSEPAGIPTSRKRNWATSWTLTTLYGPMNLLFVKEHTVAVYRTYCSQRSDISTNRPALLHAVNAFGTACGRDRSRSHSSHQMRPCGRVGEYNQADACERHAGGGGNPFAAR